MRPISRDLLVDTLADRITDRMAGLDADWLRVAIDGAPPAEPDALADALVDPLRLRGRPAVRVRAGDFLRPASLRLEYGREDADSYYDDWLDVAALNREALRPLERGGSGRVRPAHWDTAVDRAVRADDQLVPPGGVLLLSGDLLLGRGLSVDLTIHLHLTAGALARRTGPERAWTLPAYQRYAREVDPFRTADVVVRLDDPRHPALVEAS